MEVLVGCCFGSYFFCILSFEFVVWELIFVECVGVVMVFCIGDENVCIFLNVLNIGRILV